MTKFSNGREMGGCHIHMFINCTVILATGNAYGSFKFANLPLFSFLILFSFI